MSTITPAIWKAPGLGWHLRVKEHHGGGRLPTIWGLSYGGGVTFPWRTLTRKGAERKARRIIGGILRERGAAAAEQAALDSIHPRCRCVRGAL